MEITFIKTPLLWTIRGFAIFNSGIRIYESKWEKSLINQINIGFIFQK